MPTGRNSIRVPQDHHAKPKEEDAPGAPQQHDSHVRWVANSAADDSEGKKNHGAKPPEGVQPPRVSPERGRDVAIQRAIGIQTGQQRLIFSDDKAFWISFIDTFHFILLR